MKEGGEREEREEAEARRRAAEDLEHNLFVEAGAGTGKTTILVERICNIVRRGLARLTEVAAITFTEKAAGELLQRSRERLEQALESPDLEGAERERLEEALSDLERSPIGTIHGLAGQLLRERPLEAGLDPGFRTLDEVSADFEIEEAWEAWLPAALERDPAPARRALRAGADLAQFRQLGRFLLEHRDRLRPGALPEPAPVDPGAFVERWAAAQRELSVLGKDCRDPEDGAFAQISPLGERLAEARAHLSGGRREEVEALLRRLVIRPSAGNQGNWEKKDSCREAKALLAALEEDRLAFAAALEQDLLAGLASWLRGYPEFVVERLRAKGLLTFQDYLIEARDLLRRDLGVRRHFQRRFRYLLLDEFQDTDPLQVEIAFFLAEKEAAAPGWREVELAPGKLFIVGDPKQSIYRFRRADIELYQEVRERVASDPAGAVLRIRRNFRSLGGVIDWINRTFSVQLRPPPDGRYQPEYVPLLPHRPPGEEPLVLDLKTRADLGEARAIEYRREEAERLADLLLLWCREESEGPKRRWRDLAILYPRGSSIDIYEEALRSRDIPYYLDGGKEFFRRDEVAGLLNCLDALERPEDQIALVAALKSSVLGHSDTEVVSLVGGGGRLSYLADPPAGLADAPIAASLALLRDLHRQRNRLTMASLTRRLIEETGAAPAVALRGRGGLAASQNLRKLVTFAREFDGQSGGAASFGRFARWLRRREEEQTREAESPAFEEKEDVVRLLTIHKAKGLQFKVVFLVNLGGRPQTPERFLWKDERLELKLGNGDEGLRTRGLAAARDHEKLRQDAERVRLLYVAATRAEDLLVISRIAGSKPRSEELQILADHPGSAEVCPEAPPPAAPGPDEPEAPVAEVLARALEKIGARTERIRAGYRPAAAVRPSGAGAGEAPAPPRDLSAEAGGDGVAPVAEASPVAETTSVAESAPPAGSAAGTARDAARDAALALGSAVHRLLETADLRARPDDFVDQADLADLAALAAMESGIPGRAGEVLAEAARALGTQALERARRASRVHREVPFLVELEGVPGPVFGKIDLVYQTGKGYGIVDYKTDRLAPAEVDERARIHEPQLRLYARAIQKLTGRPVLNATLVFTALGVEREVDLS